FYMEEMFLADRSQQADGLGGDLSILRNGHPVIASGPAVCRAGARPRRSVSKKVLRAPAPSDEGAVSVADWGREDPKSYEFFINIEKT
ncbi:MAG: hypothetical protein IIV61_09130, partial [Oscillospiraceae bacterium]|nr:hypothetical protein [Oscillospiraceae bacterium]